MILHYLKMLSIQEDKNTGKIEGLHFQYEPCLLVIGLVNDSIGTVYCYDAGYLSLRGSAVQYYLIHCENH